MADPVRYTKSYDFSAFQGTSPALPLPAQRIDIEYAAIADAIRQLVAAVKDVRRADGKLQNGVVTNESLSGALSIGFTMRGAWTAGADYAISDGVVDDAVFYSAKVSHTATTGTRPSASPETWLKLFNIADIVVTGALSMPVATFTGDGFTKTFDLGFTAVSPNNVFVKVGGVPQDVAEYTVAGSVLTFVTAPANDFKIEARAITTTMDAHVPGVGSVTMAALDIDLATLVSGAAQKSANLSDLTDSAAARGNLGLGTAATKDVGTGEGDVPDNANVLATAKDGAWTQGISGAVARTIEQKLREVSSVLDFGAVGDCTGVGLGTDDSAAIQLALDWVASGDYRKLHFPGGKRYRVADPLTADFAGFRGCQIIMDGPITPDAAAFTALTLINTRRSRFTLSVWGGGQDANYLEADPVGMAQAFSVRSLRQCEIIVSGMDYIGRVLRVKPENLGEYKTGANSFCIYTGDRAELGSGAARCGQAFYFEGTTYFGELKEVQINWDAYGSIAYKCTDITIIDLVFGAASGPLSFQGCGSIWANLLSLGDETGTQDLLEFKSAADGTRSNRIHIQTMLAVQPATALKVTGVRQGFRVDVLQSVGCTAPAVVLDDCIDVTIGGLVSNGDYQALQIKGASSTIRANVLSTISQREGVTIDDTCSDVVVTGTLRDGSQEAAGTYAAVKCASILSGIRFNEVEVTGTSWSGAYDLAVSNLVEINGGKIVPATKYIGGILPNTSSTRIGGTGSSGGRSYLGRHVFGDDFAPTNRVTIAEPSTGRPYLTFVNGVTGTTSTDGVWIGFADQNGAFHIRSREAQPVSIWANDIERVRIASGGNTYFPGISTTASAGNAFLNSASSPANELLRSTSSLAYKRCVEDLEPARADALIERARPVWYRSKAAADDPAWGWYGLIAEELAEIDPRLVVWGYQDHHYEDVEVVDIIRTLDEAGDEIEVEDRRIERRLKSDAVRVPDGIQYDRITVMLLDVVRRQGERLAKLEAAIDPQLSR